MKMLLVTELGEMVATDESNCESCTVVWVVVMLLERSRAMVKINDVSFWVRDPKVI